MRKKDACRTYLRPSPPPPSPPTNFYPLTPFPTFISAWQGYEIVLRTLHVARSLDFFHVRSIARAEKTLPLLKSAVSQQKEGCLHACLLQQGVSVAHHPTENGSTRKIIIIIIIFIFIIIDYYYCEVFFFCLFLEFCLGALIRHRKVPNGVSRVFREEGTSCRDFEEAKNAADDIEEDLETGR